MDFTRVKNLAEKAADFADDLAIVVTELDRVAQNFISMGKDGALSGLESADKFASAATTIVGVIDPAITALASLGTLAETNDLTGKLAIFKSQLNQVLIAIQGIAQGWAFGGGKQLLSRQSGLEAAETFAKAVGTISTGVKGAIDLIDEFMHYKGQTIAAGLAAFQQNLLQVRNMLTFEATEIEAVVPAANRFEAAMTTISRNRGENPISVSRRDCRFRIGNEYGRRRRLRLWVHGWKRGQLRLPRWLCKHTDAHVFCRGPRRRDRWI
jgi:hypothetical protein